MIRIVVTGAKGRMGSRVAALVRESPDLTLAAAIDREERLEDMIAGTDAIIDFTVAQAATHHASVAAAHRTPIVIGTTGLNADQIGEVESAAKAVPVLFAPNMSVGVNVLFKLVEMASHSLGPGMHIEIEEIHHVHKLDRPSGTAKKALEIACRARGLSPERDAIIYEEDAAEGIGPPDAPASVRSFRRNEVVGDHVIRFSSGSEILSISHRARTRDLFAEGALAAARWIVGRPAGLYGMEHVLGFAPLP